MTEREKIRFSQESREKGTFFQKDAPSEEKMRKM